MNKHRAYRLRKISQGCCPHCGKPCAPYYECAKRRFDKKVSRMLKRMAACGMIARTGAMYQMGNSDTPLLTKRSGGPRDGRSKPKLGKKPITTERLVIMALARLTNGGTEDEILAQIGRIRRERLTENVWLDRTARELYPNSKFAKGQV